MLLFTFLLLKYIYIKRKNIIYKIYIEREKKKVKK